MQNKKMDAMGLEIRLVASGPRSVKDDGHVPDGNLIGKAPQLPQTSCRSQPTVSSQILGTEWRRAWIFQGSF